VAEQNTQAVVLQQPNGEKLQFELKITQVADDTTAMKSFEKGADISIASFDSSAYIAVFLALFATGLAYWFGRKSFDLTTLGFDLTLKQIGTSVEQTLNSNRELYQSQENLKLMEIRSNHRQEWINKVREIFNEIFIVLENLYLLTWFTKKVDSEMYETLIKLRKLYDLLELYLNPDEEETKKIISLLSKVYAFYSEVYNSDSKKVVALITEDNGDKIKSRYLDLKKCMQNILKNEWERVKKGE
jgi:hypothetical protein